MVRFCVDHSWSVTVMEHKFYLIPDMAECIATVGVVEAISTFDANDES